MSIWYLGMFETVEPVEVEKESESSVWILGRRHARKSDYQGFFKTFEEAKQFLVDRENRHIEQAQRSLECRKKYLAKIQAITKPTEEQVAEALQRLNV